MDGAAHILVFFRPEQPRDDDARAHGGAVEKADQHKDEAARGGNRGKSLLPEELSDDDRVGRIVKLLKKVAQKNGQRKKNKTSSDRPLRQGLFGCFRPHTKKNSFYIACAERFFRPLFSFRYRQDAAACSCGGVFILSPAAKKVKQNARRPLYLRSTRQTSNILSRRPSEIPFVSVLSPFPRPPPAFVSALPPSSLSRSHILSSRNPTDASAIPRLSEPTEGKETGMGIFSRTSS